MSDGFDASVRAAADELNAACDAMWNDHDRIEERSSSGGPRLKEKHVEAIAVAQQRLFFALLRPDALEAALARIAELEAAAEALARGVEETIDCGGPQWLPGLREALRAYRAALAKR